MEKNYMEEGEKLPRFTIIWLRVRLAVDYLFFLLYGVIGLEFLLELAGARDASGFKQFLNTVTYPFLNPFEGLFPDPTFRQHSRFKVTYLVALSIYLLLHLAVLGLFRLFSRGRKLSRF
jgi:uncharacterized protein YggT (Ycf19 family)